MFAAVIAFAVLTTLYGLIWHNLPDKRKEETRRAKGS